MWVSAEPLFNYLCEGNDWPFTLAVIRAELRLIRQLRVSGSSIDAPCGLAYDRIQELWRINRDAFCTELEAHIEFKELWLDSVSYRFNQKIEQGIVLTEEELKSNDDLVSAFKCFNLSTPVDRLGLYYHFCGGEPVCLAISNEMAAICGAFGFTKSGDRFFHLRLGQEVLKRCGPPPLCLSANERASGRSVSPRRLSKSNFVVREQPSPLGEPFQIQPSAKYFIRDGENEFELDLTNQAFFLTRGSSYVKGYKMSEDCLESAFVSLDLKSSQRVVDNRSDKVEPDVVYRVYKGLCNLRKEVDLLNKAAKIKDVRFDRRWCC